jgi:uncharacterized protein (UPF0332 family)
VNAREFVNVAKVALSVLPTCIPEACYRTSCGRAYYAAFGFARELLLSAGFTFSGGVDEHQQVVQYLLKSSDLDVKVAAGLIGQLRGTRNSADYDTDPSTVRALAFSFTYANDSVALGEQIIADLLSAQARDPRLGIP